MPNIDERRLGLVSCTLADGSASVGTGYMVTADLLLTASHVVPAEVGVANVRVRLLAQGTWHDAFATAAWRDVDLDAVLVRLCEALPDVASVAWAEEPIVADTEWQSAGFPRAGMIVESDGRDSWKSVGLGGLLYAVGGGGQGQKGLDLGVAHAPPPELWGGASGAPVLVGGRLAGFIKQVPPNFQGTRLIGVPATSLLRSPSFRLALAEAWLEPGSLPKSDAWVLVVLSEADETGLGYCVDSTLENDRDAIRSIVHESFALQSVKVSILDAMRSPAHWLKLVRALCLAPIAIFDATDFEPAVMLALGVRAVVRRGVTITSTARTLSPEQMSKLPFNVKETKLVHHGDAYELGDERHPYNAIATAIKKGWHESRSHLDYLDLPAYDGVRSAYPAASNKDIGAVERILMLCPFTESYAGNWRWLSNVLAKRYARRRPARMLDLASPRLVGQALYEGIRWSRTCVIDWSGWRANVFFEFGARLACSHIGPVCLIDADDAAAGGADLLSQKRRLLDMWRPTAYHVPETDEPRLAAEGRRELSPAFELHDAIAANRAPAVPLAAMPHDATYRTCSDTFEWVQERITIQPHEFLRRSVVDPLGPDPQHAGVQPILYATDNAGFSAALQVSVRERWVAAWYYLVNRYPREQWATDAELREQVRTLANQVLQFGPRKDESDPHLRALRDVLYDVIDELDDLGGPAHEP